MQKIIIAIILIAAVAFLIRKSALALAGKQNKGSCCGGCGCGTKSESGERNDNGR